MRLITRIKEGSSLSRLGQDVTLELHTEPEPDPTQNQTFERFTAAEGRDDEKLMKMRNNNSDAVTRVAKLLCCDLLTEVL